MLKSADKLSICFGVASDLLFASGPKFITDIAVIRELETQ